MNENSTVPEGSTASQTCRLRTTQANTSVGAIAVIQVQPVEMPLKHIEWYTRIANWRNEATCLAVLYL